jgi:hypothetical protein
VSLSCLRLDDREAAVALKPAWIFDRFGWQACVAGIGLALLAGGLLASRLKGSSA